MIQRFTCCQDFYFPQIPQIPQIKAQILCSNYSLLLQEKRSDIISTNTICGFICALICGICGRKKLSTSSLKICICQCLRIRGFQKIRRRRAHIIRNSCYEFRITNYKIELLPLRYEKVIAYFLVSFSLC